MWRTVPGACPLSGVCCAAPMIHVCSNTAATLGVGTSVLVASACLAEALPISFEGYTMWLVWTGGIVRERGRAWIVIAESCGRVADCTGHGKRGGNWLVATVSRGTRKGSVQPARIGQRCNACDRAAPATTSLWKLFLRKLSFSPSLSQRVTERSFSSSAVINVM